MKHCKEFECKCKNELAQECDCKKCEDAEMAAWRKLGLESLKKIWDNPKDEEAARQYAKRYSNI